MLPLASLGQRIVILGPSNAGKSTLARSLSEKLAIPAVHLDQLRHLPNTDWQQRPEEEFAALHDAAIMSESWVMEGNYSRLMPQRIGRATGAILVTSNRWLRLARYLRRTLINEAARAGHLEGARDSIKWEMIDWILIKTPNRSARYPEIIRAAKLPAVACTTAGELTALYRNWELRAPR